ncbi:hypothetical protein ACQP2U_36485 [Nocardia sp. CA-084685]|uniref:hypothetical protein n=1 Tax=Nocardia sp. CA-084685 TaxID=3239970 RepID=UPI003D967D5F
MTTPQHPERDDASPEKPADKTNESESLEPSGTAWAAPASSGPWEAQPVEPAEPLPAQPAVGDFSARPWSAGPGAQPPAQRAAAEPAPDLVARPQPSNPVSGDPAPEWAQPEPWDDASAARYDQDRPGTVYPPINDSTTPTTLGGYPQDSAQSYTPGPRSGSQPLSIIGFVCAGISLLFCPYLFGPVGIILGIIGHKKGESLGKWAAIASAISLIIGIILFYAVFSGSMIPDTE